MTLPRESIVMINRNGGEYLRGALSGLIVALNRTWKDSNEFEFIFVDNDSTDDSIRAAQRALQDVPWSWHIVREPVAGVNSARLAGLKSARGRYVIFADNDIDFDPHWLNGYLAAFAAHPEVRVFAGRVLVGEIQSEVPLWLDLDDVYSRPSIVVRCDNGEATISAGLGDKRFEGPVGPNMAFKRSVFDDYGPFDTNYGLRPGSLIAGAEAEYFHRLSKHGEQFLYVPAACVRHPLRQHQISKSYFRRRLNGVGRVLARMQRDDGISAKRIWGIKRYLFRQFAESLLQYAGTWFQRCPKKQFFYRCNISMILGQIQEDFANRRQSEFEKKQTLEHASAK